MANAQHSAASFEHGTPVQGTDLARYVAGGAIGCDPFSSAYWNHYTVKAATYYDLDHSGLDQRNPWRGFCLVNPPGGISETDPATKIFLKSLNKPFIREIDDYSVFIMEESNGQYTLEERVQ